MSVTVCVLCMFGCSCLLFFFFFTDPATTEIYTLSLHDALPICCGGHFGDRGFVVDQPETCDGHHAASGRARRRLYRDRKSTRLNSSHSQISYAVFCLKKKKKKKKEYNIYNKHFTPEPQRHKSEL